MLWQNPGRVRGGCCVVPILAGADGTGIGAEFGEVQAEGADLVAGHAVAEGGAARLGDGEAGGPALAGEDGGPAQQEAMDEVITRAVGVPEGEQ